MKYREQINVTLAGAPNVGKSTLFNALTGMRQHTGNWTGKTVETAKGYFRHGGVKYEVTDIPGTYSLEANSAEEEVAKRFIEEHANEATVIVCDATALERSLVLAISIIEIAKKCAVFLNLCDEASRRGIVIDSEKLEEALGVPVISGSARRRDGVGELKELIAGGIPEREKKALDLKEICRKSVSSEGKIPRRDRVLDRIFTGSVTSFPVMVLLLLSVLWLTVCGANYPSSLLWKLSSFLEGAIVSGMTALEIPEFLVSFFANGVFRTAAWVISVMLPPMAIFFPLFTLLEDFGYLPRVAFCLDRVCRACGGNGRQALCMCEGLGCNAVGVTGCRIIDSPKERLVSILTNSFIPCNGRFPALIALTSAFFGASSPSSLILAGIIVLSVAASFTATKLLSSTLFRGMPSSFILELPPYRTPRVGEVAVRSIIDRTLKIACRALAVAAPAGAVIWCLANVTSGGVPILRIISGALDPVGKFFGLDGVILFAFILGLPANEIVLPIMIMIYTSTGTLPEADDTAQILRILTENGWTVQTAVCTVIFYLFHSPCSTTLITIKKETGSFRYTALGAALPTFFGFALCLAAKLAFSVFA